MRHLQKQRVEDTEFVLTDKEQAYLGPDLVLQRCHLVLRTSARAMTINKVQLIDCKIEAKKPLVNFQMWCGADIKNCTFTGKFTGNDFGHWPEQDPNGNIQRCDFANAVLDGCRFMDCDIGSISLPGWPCFTILHPCRLRSEIEAIEWPGKLRFWAADLPDEPAITHGLVEYAPTLGKRFGCSEEQICESLQRLGSVLM